MLKTNHGCDRRGTDRPGPVTKITLKNSKKKHTLGVGVVTRQIFFKDTIKVTVNVLSC